jgi:hypothetical protein
MTLKRIPRTFQEGIDPPWMRAELPEVISNIHYVKLKDKRDPNLGLFGVDGYYVVKGDKSFPLLRMEKEYQASSFEEANDKAKEDGLARGLLIERIIGEPVECNLGSIKLTDLIDLNKK